MVEAPKFLEEKPKRLPTFEESSSRVVSLLDRNTFDELHADLIEALTQRRLTEVYHASREHGSGSAEGPNLSLLKAEYQLKGIADTLEMLGDQKAAEVLRKTTEDVMIAGLDKHYKGHYR